MASSNSTLDDTPLICNSAGPNIVILLTIESVRYTILIWEEILDMPVYKQFYSRYAYIAFRENRHVTLKAKMILN